MNFLTSPLRYFWAGVVCVVLGFLLPLLMVLGVIESSLGLTFFTYILQLAGLILGVISTAGLALRHRRRKKDEDAEKEDARESTTGWMQ